jgi:Xaa-Pro aminopeptidase
MRRSSCPLLALLVLAAAGLAGPAPLDPVEARRTRREHLARELGKGYALVLGQPLTDVLQPRQEGHFLYLTGVRDPDASLLLAGRGARPLSLPRRDRKPLRTREVVFLRDGSPAFAQFYGLEHRPGEESALKLGTHATRAAPRGGAGLARTLGDLLPKGATLHVPAYAGPDHAPVREIRAALVAGLAEARPDVRIVDLHPRLTRMRAVKDSYEIDALSRAVDATMDAFRAAAREIRPGRTEGAVDGALLYGVRRAGAQPAYTFVVAGGVNGAIPHYFRNEAPLVGGDLLVIDAGAAVDRYAADVTRTFPVSGRFTPRQRELYEAVLAAQKAGIAAVKPGATLKDVDRAARTVLKKAGLAGYFIHATCHHVGLDVHDPGPGRLAPGMTITVEPGVYIREEKIGIRIEDVVLVTKRGSRVLGNGLPKEPDEVEKLLADARD